MDIIGYKLQCRLFLWKSISWWIFYNKIWSANICDYTFGHDHLENVIFSETYWKKNPQNLFQNKSHFRNAQTKQPLFLFSLNEKMLTATKLFTISSPWTQQRTMINRTPNKYERVSDLLNVASMRSTSHDCVRSVKVVAIDAYRNTNGNGDRTGKATQQDKTNENCINVSVFGRLTSVTKQDSIALHVQFRFLFFVLAQK